MNSTLEILSSGFKSEYERSRNGNLRCFPSCHNGTHYEQSFCGSVVRIRVTPPPSDDTHVFIFGEFVPMHQMTKSPGMPFPLESQKLLKEGGEDSKYFVANRSRGGNMIVGDSTPIVTSSTAADYIIVPKRKWHLPLQKGKKEYVFATYMVVDSTIVSMTTSKTFSVTTRSNLSPKSSKQDIKAAAADASSSAPGSPKSVAGLGVIHPNLKLHSVPLTLPPSSKVRTYPTNPDHHHHQQVAKKLRMAPQMVLPRTPALSYKTTTTSASSSASSSPSLLAAPPVPFWYPAANMLQPQQAATTTGSPRNYFHGLYFQQPSQMLSNVLKATGGVPVSFASPSSS